MSPLNHEEVERLSLMYEGDKSRDASSAIRGFLYQDYIMIKSLTEKNVEYVCSEYLEDVDVFYNDGRFAFIQVKYYPAKDPAMKDITTDLYYQFLRLEMLGSDLRAIPMLYIHGKKEIPKPTLKKVKEYIGVGENMHQPSADPDEKDPVTFLRTRVYTTNKKDEQKKALFSSKASVKSVEAFYNALEVSNEKGITEYKQYLLGELSKTYKNPDSEGEEENWQLILLGLALSYIQRRYMMGDPGFHELRVDKKEFDAYMTNAAQTKTERTIASYLVAGVAEEYEQIIRHNTLSELQQEMLGRIYQKTVHWIGNIGATPEGQYQLLNTLSQDEAGKIAGYPEKSIDKRLLAMAECKEAFTDFLNYLWKIMLNICQDQVKNQKQMDAHPELLDPACYMVPSVKDYVCLKFPEDKSVNYSVILPPAGKKITRAMRRIVERMVKMEQKPEKWFIESTSLARGKNVFTYSTADTSENPTIADLVEDSFYIECMDCIGVDEGEWCRHETCSDCIFALKCVKEGT